DEIESDMLAFEPHSIATGAFAGLWRVGHDQLDLISLELPVAAERRPAGAFQLKRAAGFEARGKDAELQRGGRELYFCLLARARLSWGASRHNRDRQRERESMFAERHSFHLRYRLCVY